MSYDYDEEPEHDDGPSIAPEPPPDSTPAGTFTATVAREEIVALVAERFFAQMSGYYGHGDKGMREAVKDELTKLVREAAEEHIEEITRDAVSAALHDMLQNGWPKTDHHGREAGRLTVRDMALEQLTKVDGYNRESHATKLAEEIFKETFKKELQPLVDEAKQRVRNALNKNVDEAIRTALLEGAGLRAR